MSNPNNFLPFFAQADGLTGAVFPPVPNARAAFFLEVSDGAGVAIAALSANAKLQTPPKTPVPAVWAFSDDSSGVYGISQHFDAIVGESQSPGNAGVTGRNTSSNPNDFAVGIYGTGGTHAGKFDGHVQVNGDLDCTGKINGVGQLQNTITQLENGITQLQNGITQLQNATQNAITQLQNDITQLQNRINQLGH